MQSNFFCLWKMGGSFEDPYMAIMDMWNNKKVFFWCCALLVSVSFYNFSSISLSQRVSSVYRALWDSVRTVTVWVLSLALGLETFVLKSFYYQFSGFVLLIFGNFLYNEILKIRAFGLGADLKDNNPKSVKGTISLKSKASDNFDDSDETLN